MFKWKKEWPSYCALDVRVLLRWTQVLLPLPLPHGFQVVWVKGGDPPTCRHLLDTDTPSEVGGGQMCMWRCMCEYTVGARQLLGTYLSVMGSLRSSSA